MPTLDDLANQVEGYVRGFVAQQDQMSTLSADVPATGGFTLAVDDQNFLGAGLYEVESELVQVTSTSQDGGVVPAWGRAQRGSAATEHTAGVRVTKGPLVPRSVVLRAVNDQIVGSYPTLFGVSVVEDTTKGVGWTYDLPATALSVVDVRWLPPTGLGYWDEIDSWRVNQRAEDGVTVDLGCFPTPGQKIRFTVTAKPTAIRAADDITLSGLQVSAAEAICLLAAASLLPAFESARLGLNSVEQSQRTEKIQGGSATSAAKYFYALGQEKLQAERDRLMATVPLRMVTTW